jgi:outer membrane immunogenic protein
MVEITGNKPKVGTGKNNPDVAPVSQAGGWICDKITPDLLIFRRVAAVKKLLLASAALMALIPANPGFAADLPAKTYTKAPVYVPPPIYNWTGFYIGGNVGWGWARESSTEIAPGTGSFPIGTAFTRNNLNGFLGGVQGGYNWQVAPNFVVGLEGEYSWSDLSGTETTISTVNGFSSTVTAKTKDFALATGRLGYAADNWLFYVKGGGAWTQGNSSGVGILANGTLFDTTSTSANRSGWTVGVGVEWGFAPNWSAKIEYNYLDMGSTNIAVLSSAGIISNVSSSETINVVKAGVNYRFNWGAPVVAKY